MSIHRNILLRMPWGAAKILGEERPAGAFSSRPGGNKSPAAAGMFFHLPDTHTLGGLTMSGTNNTYPSGKHTNPTVDNNKRDNKQRQCCWVPNGSSHTI